MTQPDATKLIAEMRERCEQATPAPWKWVGVDLDGNDGMEQVIGVEDTPRGAYAENQMGELVMRKGNKEFVAHARTDLPLALDALEIAFAALRKIKDTQGKVCGQYQDCSHPSCESSYSSWAIADKGLLEVTTVLEGK